MIPHDLFRRSWCYLPDNETALFVASPIGNRMDGRMENEFEKAGTQFTLCAGKPFMERTVLGSFYLGLLDEGNGIIR